MTQSRFPLRLMLLAGIITAPTVLTAQSTGSIQATLRNWNNANATASLTRFVRWPSGQQVNGSNPGTFTSVPPSGYWVEGYQRGPFSDYEYWGSVYANVTAGNTATVTITRYTPYTEDFWFERNGTRLNPNDYIPPGSMVTPKARIRNRHSTSWSVYVNIGWRYGSGPTAGTMQSSTVTVGANSTATITLSNMTLSSTTEGDLYAYIKTSSKNVDVDWNLTDSWDWTKMFGVRWGSIQATLRNWNNANATASLTRFVRRPSGQQVNGSNPGTFTSVPPSGYWVEGYQRGPFSDYEYWGSVYANVTAGNTATVTITRYTPYTEDFWFERNGIRLNPTDVVPAGITLTPKVKIRNRDTRGWSTYVSIGWRYGTGPTMGTGQSSTVQVAAGSSTTISLPNLTLSTTTGGNINAYIKTTSSNSDISWILTDSWDWTTMCRVIAPLAQIVDFTPPTGTVTRGQHLQATVRVKNIGSAARTFWVGLSFASPGATLPSWPVGWYDVRPLQTNLLNPNETQTLTFQFTVPNSLVPGSYTASAAVWEGYNYEQHKMIGIDDNGNPSVGGSAYDRRDFIPSFILGPYTITSSPLVDQLFSAAQQTLLGYDLFESYRGTLQNGHKKVLFYVGATGGGSIGGVQVNGGGTVLFDLADLARITPEGQDSTVTIWIDAQTGAGVGLSMGLNVECGLTTYDFGPGEFALADDRRLLSGTVGAQFLGVAFTAASYSTNGGWNGAKLQWTTDFAVSATITGNAQSLIAREVHYGEILRALNNAQGTNLHSLVTSLVNNLYGIGNQIVKPLTNDDGAWDVGDGDGSWNTGSWGMPLSCSKASTSTELFGAYFCIDVPPGKTNVSFRLDGGTGSSYLYARRGARPTRTVYDYASANPGTSQFISVAQPTAGRWYFLVDAHSQYANVNYVARLDGPTSVGDSMRLVPVAYSLKQNFPNPFNPSTTILFDLPNSSYVDLCIYNTLGQRVTTLVSGEMTPGSYQITWDANGVASGVYTYRLSAGSFAETKKLLLLR